MRLPTLFLPTLFLRALEGRRLGLAVLAWCGAAYALADPSADAPRGDREVSFNDAVRPILVQHCLACHGGVKQAGGISFVTRALAMAEGDSGDTVIKPGDHQASYLYERVTDEDDDSRMPPREHGPRLDEAELAILRQWIDAGAPWETPWAFRPPQRSEPHTPNDAQPVRSRIDRFVLERLKAEGLAPAPEADRKQWLRRVSFDLVGLPPTSAERIEFETDQAPDAYERVVDRLLASPHFGERWASVWLDLARYADTMGFEKDPPRDIWPYRDWVVQAFNADMPYDDFLLKQFAGDLVEGATVGDRLATAFHRNTQTNTEGGTDDEEYRWSAVVDRVDTTWQSVLGMTMGCARCHDHPYDPLWQEDYYRFAAFFNTTRDADLHEDFPKFAAPKDPSQYEAAQSLDDQLAAVRRDLDRTGREAESHATWTPLALDKAESTGETRLEIGVGERGVEVIAVGTVTDRSTYTLRAPAPIAKVTALRIDASPKDPAVAVVTPEMGFVLSTIRVYVERQPVGPPSVEPQSTEGQVDNKVSLKEGVVEAPVEEELLLGEVVADEVDGFFRPIESLRDGNQGWGPYTRIRHPRWATFVLNQPVDLKSGDRLRIELKHGMATDGQGPLVIQRLTVSTTDDPALSQLATQGEFRDLREREEVLIKARNAIDAVATPVLTEQPAWLRRETHLFERGNWLAPQQRLEASTPAEIPGKAADRLELGRWLGSDENPLTARVMVNRVWSQMFGVGLTPTVEDFGSTGVEPSHPELLDDLAVRFRDDFDWSVKQLLREIALSATYRQDARVTAELVEIDPSNRLLARGPRGRLRAEMVRDQALMLSGRFNPSLGGPPVMPFQPDSVWRTVYNNQKWEVAEGPERFRRALYTYWKRTAAYPSMMAFDAPSREQCTVRRPTTNTPLQALVTLNDPAFVELAEGMADRMLARTGESSSERIAWAADEATGRPLPEASLQELVRLYETTVADGSADERFAMTIVANVIMNLDAALTK